MAKKLSVLKLQRLKVQMAWKFLFSCLKVLENQEHCLLPFLNIFSHSKGIKLKKLENDGKMVQMSG